MTVIQFRRNDRPTIGVEIELGLVDGQTMELTSAFGQVADELQRRATPPAPLAGEKQSDDRYVVDDQLGLKPELMQSVVEVVTGVCHTVGEAEADLRGKVARVQAACDKLGLGLWWGATHPFSRWSEQQVTPTDRYQGLVDHLQEMARRLVTFGMHVHVGVDTGDKAVMICDRIMRYLPVLLAISSSSPFWEGRNTGLHSHRSKVMEGLPTAGLPTLMRNWSEYVWLVNHMIDTGFINSIREIWWDVRPHHNFGTVEVRVCDMPGNLDDVLAIAAMVQCLVQALSEDIDQGAYQHDCHPMMVRQNKWRATRYGVTAQLVDSYTYEVLSVADVVDGMVERLLPIADRLGCVAALERCRSLARGPSSATRQLELVESGTSLVEMTRELTEQSRLDA
ncbi:MAG: YbdK family carboxylate-amine ligase [Planctomycetota bacterium]